jgi:hypothetical protein
MRERAKGIGGKMDVGLLHEHRSVSDSHSHG